MTTTNLHTPTDIDGEVIDVQTRRRRRKMHEVVEGWTSALLSGDRRDRVITWTRRIVLVVQHTIEDVDRWPHWTVLTIAVPAYLVLGGPLAPLFVPVAALIPALAWWVTRPKRTKADADADKVLVAKRRRRIVRRRATALGWLLLTLAIGVTSHAGAPRDVAAVVLALAALTGAGLASAVPRHRGRIGGALLRNASNAIRCDVDQMQLRHPRLHELALMWHGRQLANARLQFPSDFRAHAEQRRDDLEAAVTWSLCGAPPETPAQHLHRPEYLLSWNAMHGELLISAAPKLPQILSALALARTLFREGADVASLGGIPLGQVARGEEDQMIGGIPLAILEPKRHALFAGGTQFGKSSGVRHMAAAGMLGGLFPAGVAVLDGKGSGSFAPFMVLEGVIGVGHRPNEWIAIVKAMVAKIEETYEQLLRYRAGLGPKPDLARGLIIIDEIQQILISCPELVPLIDSLARLALEAGWILWVMTQRPDARDAIPGAVKDQLDGRGSFGPLSRHGGEMVHGHHATRSMATLPIAGRMLANFDGTPRSIQVPWLPMPVDDPRVTRLYPARVPGQAHGPHLTVVRGGTATGPTGTTRGRRKRAATSPADTGEEVSSS